MLVLGTVNASVRVNIDARTLLRCFEDAQALAENRYYLSTFFTECSLQAIARYMMFHELPADVVLSTYRRMRDLTGDEKRAVEVWLGEMAHAASLGARVP